MKMKPNEAQKLAIETIDKNISVNASAGTGKTRVLTERYLEILENGKLPVGREIESIVAITFTTKASGEMKSRISSELYDRRVEDPKYLDYYNQMNRANISTIHSFCTKLLRENPVEADVDPNFAVMDDYISNQILNSSIREVLSQELQVQSVMGEFMVELKINRVEDLIGPLKSLYIDRRTDLRTDEEILTGIEEISNVNFDEAQLNFIVDGYEEIGCNSRKNSKMYKLINSQEWEEFKSGDYSLQREAELLKFILDGTGSNAKYADLIDELKELILSASLKYEIANMKYYELVLGLLEKIDLKYGEEKSARGYLDYEDLLLKCNELLDDEVVLKRYRDEYKYIMIDEYQDTNRIQRSIFYKLCSNESELDRGNLFVVGDPKQSIYGFRGADLEAYNETLDDILASGGEIINLDINYRSTKNVIDVVNSTFVDIMDYYSKMEHFEEGINESIEILDAVEYPEDMDEYEIESAVIVERIKEAVEAGYNYGDMAILFERSTKLKALESALQDSSIPYINSSSNNFFRQREIIDLLNLLKIISNLEDDLSLVGLLRSPLVGMSDDEILKLSRIGGDYLFDDLKTSGEESVVAQAVAEKLLNLSAQSPRMEISEVVGKAIELFRVSEVYAMQKFPAQSLANIEKFQRMSKEFSIVNGGHIEDFIDYIEERRTVKETEQEVEVEGLDAVSLMSIHGSKGLQFKLVILYDTSSNAVTDRSSMRYDHKLGLGIAFENRSGLHSLIGETKKARENAELDRLLYVAMTRAEEKLIVSGVGYGEGAKIRLINRLLHNSSREDIEYRNLEVNQNISQSKFSTMDLNGVGEVVELPLMSSGKNSNYKTISSITAFQNFKKCKLEYYYKYKLGLKDYEFEEDVNYDELEYSDPVGVDGLTKGIIVHEAIEQFIESGYDKNTIVDIIEEKKLDLNESAVKLLEDYYNSYVSLHLPLESKTEVEFTLKLDEGYINGFIDLVQWDGDGLIIRDFKTNVLRDKAGLVEYYSPQLIIYALASEKLFGLPVKRAEIVFLTDGSAVGVDIGSNATAKTVEEFNKFLKFISTNDSIVHYENGCGECDYCKIKQ